MSWWSLFTLIGILVGRSTGCFSPLEAFRVSYCTMKSSPQHGLFQVRISSDLLGLVSKVHGVFGNRNFLQPLDDNQGQQQ